MDSGYKYDNMENNTYKTSYGSFTCTDLWKLKKYRVENNMWTNLELPTLPYFLSYQKLELS